MNIIKKLKKSNKVASKNEIGIYFFFLKKNKKS